MTDELNLSNMNWCKNEIERLRQRVKELELSLAAQKQEWAKAYDIGVTCKHELAELRKAHGEPVEWQVKLENCWHTLNGTNSKAWESSGYEVRPLYTSAPSIPEGWKLVPVVPTEEMWDAGNYASAVDNLEPVWEAMLAAAPKYNTQK